MTGTAAGLVLACILSATVATGGVVKLRVVDTRVDLRCKPGLSGEVIYAASRGDLLTAANGVDGEWIEVVAPGDATLYVYAELVRNGVVAVPTLQARSGDGIEHQTVCVLKKGDKLVIRGQSGDWLKIAPPPGCTVWVARKQVESPDAPAERPKPEPTPVVSTAVEPPVRVREPEPPPKPMVSAPVTVPAPVMPVRREPAGVVAPASAVRRDVAVFAPDELVGSMAQGVETSHSGVLRLAGPVYKRPSPYCIIDTDSRGRGVTQCYVLGSSSQLAVLLGTRMRVDGAEYWVQGVRHPVLVPKRIHRAE